MIKRFFWWTIGLGALLIIAVGPRPIDDQNYKNSTYYRNTIRSLENISIDNTQGDLLANQSSIDITPTHPIHLGGFSSRKANVFTGIHDHVFAQAISISNGGEIVSIINAEFLLPLDQLIEAVVKKTGIKRELLFFNATHTHSGPGAYQDNWVHEFSLGKFDKDYFEYLSDRLAQVIMASRSKLKPVILKYRRFQPTQGKEFVVHSVSKAINAYDTIHTLSFHDHQDHLLAMLVSFSAHPTIMGADNNYLDGDYPGELRRVLERQLQVPVIFAIGAPGGVTSIKHAKNDSLEQKLQWRDQYAAKLSEEIIKGQNIKPLVSRQGLVSSWLLPVQLRPFLLEINDKLALAPYLPEHIIHPAKSYIHVLRIAGITLFGMPADYFGDLARSLEQWGDEHDCHPWVQSFNGDYIGYLSPSSLYEIPHYTTRDANFFGRWSGDYFNELAQKICNKYPPSASNP